MRIINYLAGVLLAVLGAGLALDGVVFAWNHDGPGLGPTALGTLSAVTGAIAWGKSFGFVPSGWSKKFYFVFLLPVVVFYLGFLALALRSYDPGEYEVFWLAPFFALSVPAWYWQIRRVLRSPAGALEFRSVPYVYVPNEKREWLMLSLANVCVPLFVTWHRYLGRVDAQGAILVAISSLLIVNFTVVLTVYRLRKKERHELPKGYISWAVGLALVCGLLAIGGVYL